MRSFIEWEVLPEIVVEKRDNYPFDVGCGKQKGRAPSAGTLLFFDIFRFTQTA